MSGPLYFLETSWDFFGVEPYLSELTKQKFNEKITNKLPGKQFVITTYVDVKSGQRFPTKIKIDRAYLHVQLDQQLSSEQYRELSRWLQKAMVSEFGSSALAVVEFNSATAASKHESASNSKGLITALTLFFGLCLVAGGSIFYRRKKRKPIPNVAAIPAQTKKEVPRDPAAEQLADIQRTTATLVYALGKDFEVCLELWDAQDLDGRRKIAATMDAIFAQSKMPQFSDENEDSQWKIPKRIADDRLLMAVCRSFGSVVPTWAKQELLERAKIDLMTLTSRHEAIAPKVTKAPKRRKSMTSVSEQSRSS